MIGVCGINHTKHIRNERRHRPCAKSARPTQLQTYGVDVVQTRGNAKYILPYARCCWRLPFLRGKPTTMQ